jgi:hypothetical protein
MGQAACTGEMTNAYNTKFGKYEGETHFENLGVEGKIKLQRILGKNLAQDRDQRRALVNTVMNFRVP